MISATSISPSTRAKSSRLATEQLYDVSNASKKLGLVKPDAGFCVDGKDCSLKSQLLLPSFSSSRQEHCKDCGVLTCRCNYLGVISFPSRRKPVGLHCGRHGSASQVPSPRRSLREGSSLCPSTWPPPARPAAGGGGGTAAAVPLQRLPAVRLARR